MAQLKVRKKDPVVFNAILYLGLSFVFVYLQYAYRHQLSPVSMVYLRKSIELFWYLAVPFFISSVLLWRMSRLAIISYVFCVLLVSFKVVEGLFIEFNKIIVVALFFYVVFSYFIYQLLSVYWRVASINPNYLKTDLFSPMLKNISCQLSQGELTVAGVLTNWDESGCFIRLANAQKMPRKVQVIVRFGEREFHQEGEVVAQAHDLTGVGIKFKEIPKDLKVFNWSEFVELIQELGFNPERLR